MKRLLASIAIIAMAVVSVVMCCSSAASPTNEAQRFVGTWSVLDGEEKEIGKATFNTDGTVSGKFSHRGEEGTFRYGVSCGGTLYISGGFYTAYGRTASASYYVSPDGKTVFFADVMFKKQ